MRIAHDYATGNIRRLGGDACQLHGQRVGQRHVAIVAIDKNRIIRRDRIHHVFGRKLGIGPFGLVPVSTQNPFTFGSLARLLANAAHVFFWSGGIVELYLVELRSAVDKVHVRIVEPRQQ